MSYSCKKIVNSKGIIKWHKWSLGDPFTLIVSTILLCSALCILFCSTLCILETSEQVLCQTVKTQMKCSISSGSALFAKIKQSSGTAIHHYLENYI